MMGIESPGTRRPNLVVIAGPPASGKSTLGRAIARRTAMAYLDLDTLSAPLLEAHLERTPGFKDSDEYRRFFRAREYRALFDVACENLGLHCDCIVVAPFSRERRDATFFSRMRAERDIECSVVAITVTIDMHRWMTNIRSRGAERDAGKLDVLNTAASAPDGSESVWDADVRLSVAFDDLYNDFDTTVAHLIRRI
ncbi:MAG: AAA family ATPase [Spirochaetales bacterium]|nr:AAA family ATPase [Spirochaetales bacterium]